MSVSILMPVYNAAPYLEKCLNSIRHQSDTNWELIAVDDHSTDNSWGVLQSYQLKDPRIKACRNPGRGIIHALRFALQQSRGTWITRMDADDIMATHKVEALRRALEGKGPEYLSTGLVAYFSDEKLGEGYKKYAYWLNELTLQQQHYQHIYKECVIPSPCWMISRADLLKCGGFSPDKYPEDYDLCFRFYEQKIKIIGVPDLLHYWRDHGKRASRNQEVYADNFFMPLKMEYFIQLDYDSDREVVVWGAGKKGKRIAKWLLKQQVPFTWVCNNPKKWGRHIYDQPLFSCQKILSLEKVQILVAVASPKGQKDIQHFSRKQGFKTGKDIFFFC